MWWKKAVIGFDFGGSHVSAAAVTKDGALVTDVFRANIDTTWSAEKITEVIAGQITLAKKAAQQRRFTVIGFGGGAPGPMNMDTGQILETPNLVTLRGWPLVQKLIAQTGLKRGKINNDANLDVLGEALYGAGRGYRIVYGVTLGTGFGHGLVIDGRLIVGEHFLAMENALSPIQVGSKTTIENIVSSAGLKQAFFNLTGETKEPVEIAALARQGRSEAQKVWHDLGQHLGFTFSWMQNSLDPGVIIISGNMAKAMDLFEAGMREELAAHTWPESQTKIVLGQLGETAVIKGGAGLIFNT